MNDTGSGLAKYFGQPTGTLVWSLPEKSFDPGYKCEVFNYSNGPIFDVRLIFDVMVRKAVTNNGGGLTASDTIKVTQWGAYIPKIDQGADKPFVFTCTIAGGPILYK